MSSNSVDDYDFISVGEKEYDYAVYIFAYNERPLIEKLLTRIDAIQTRSFDIMMGDDGSEDESCETEFIARHGVRGVTRLKKNSGLSSNIKAALHWLQSQDYKGLILINVKNRDNPESITLFVERLQEGFGYIQGSRFIKDGKHINTPWIRYFAIRLLHAPLFSMSSGKWMTDTTNGYRAFSMDFLNDPRVFAFQDRFKKYEIEQYLAWKAIRLNYNVTEIPVERAYPIGQYTSHIKPGLGWINMISPLINLMLRRYE